MCFLLNWFQWLNEAHTSYGGSPILLKVYWFKCKFQLKNTVTATSSLVFNQISRCQGLAKLAHKFTITSSKHIFHPVRAYRETQRTAQVQNRSHNLTPVVTRDFLEANYAAWYAWGSVQTERIICVTVQRKRSDASRKVSFAHQEAKELSKGELKEGLCTILKSPDLPQRQRSHFRANGNWHYESYMIYNDSHCIVRIRFEVESIKSL